MLFLQLSQLAVIVSRLQKQHISHTKLEYLHLELE